MALTNETNVRNALKIQDTTVLTTGEVTQAITDASNNITINDEYAERMLACFYIAESISWDKVKNTGDGVSFETPKPEKYDSLYRRRLRQLGRGKPKKVNWNVHDTTEY